MLAMPSPARAEREALCDLFLEVGPDGPTLCEGWTNRDLAAHLVVREGRPDAMPGILGGPLARYGERVRQGEAAKDFVLTVERVRSGPPVWNPMRVGFVERITNTVEYFVHHEDVRRAAEGWEPRELSAELDEDLWSALSRASRMLARRAPCGLVLTLPDGRHTVAKKGEPSVVASGPVGELVLFVYGRQAHARVELSGPDDLVDAMRRARFGI